MDDKIFLLTNRSNKSANKSTYMNVDIKSDSRLLPSTDLEETLSLYDLYNDERDNCGKFRLILDINALCSNVLFNKITEIISGEGSDHCIILNGTSGISINPAIRRDTAVTRYDAIRDTEYSHESLGNLSYHPGSDLFNNHLLRANDFVHVGLELSSGNTVFNTIQDKIRDYQGNVVSEYPYYGTNSAATIEKHIYNTDNLLSLSDAFSERCVDKEGWFGFENRTTIDIPNAKLNGKNLTINKVINSEDSCSFIDMYPDRTLFSFSPKYNYEKGRPEYNWKYILTYPYQSDHELFNIINKNSIGAVKIHSAVFSHTNNGDKLVRLETIIKHNLQKGDYVNLYYTQSSLEDVTPTLYTKKVKVASVGDSSQNNKNIYFNIRFDDINDIIKDVDGKVVSEDGRNIYFFYKKNVNGVICDYYFRKFKKIKYNGSEPRSEMNKLAFGTNIFGDSISQIVYTDDIDVSGLIDNLGRQVSSIYLTIIKNNSGYEAWYNSGITSGDSIEYSHCFGKITSGVEMPEDMYNYNVHKMHNLDLSKVPSKYISGTSLYYTNFKTQPLCIESAITTDLDEFYGDAVEFDRYNYQENIIDNVKYRFNTAQRECCSNEDYFNLYEDTIIADDYYPSGQTSEGSRVYGFTVEQKKINLVTKIGTDQNYEYAFNLNPEGYFYTPHYEINLYDISEDLESVNGDLINYDGTLSNITYGTVNDIVEITCPVAFNGIINETIAFYDIDAQKTYYGYISSISSDKLTINVKMLAGVIQNTLLKNNQYLILEVSQGCPTYAIYLPKYDKFVWRMLVAPSELQNTSELYDVPFSNGAFYIHKCFNLFLRRQDPYGEYFMSNPEEDYRGIGGMCPYDRKLRKKNKAKLNIDTIEYISEEMNNNCVN